MRSLVSRLALAAALSAVAAPAFAEGNMPQFDFANPLTLAQIVWGGVIFYGLYSLFSNVGLPRVAGILEAREQAIAGDLEQARLAKESADHAVAELNAARRVAYAEAQAAMSTAAQKAKEAAAARAAEVNARLDAQLSESEARIGAARASAMAALREAASDTAEALITRLSGQTPAPEALRDAVGAALAARSLTHA